MKWIAKNFYNMIFGLLAGLAPIKPLILTLVFLVIVDFIFGIYRAYKNKELITSRKMSNTITKVLLYNIVIIALFYSDKYILETGLDLEKLGAGLICLVELRSVDESWKVIFGWSVLQRLTDNLSRGKSTTKNLE